jgi:hypothetical protein
MARQAPAVRIKALCWRGWAGHAMCGWLQVDKENLHVAPLVDAAMMGWTGPQPVGSAEAGPGLWDGTVEQVPEEAPRDWEYRQIS